MFEHGRLQTSDNEGKAMAVQRARLSRAAHACFANSHLHSIFSILPRRRRRREGLSRSALIELAAADAISSEYVVLDGKERRSAVSCIWKVNEAE